MVVISVVGVGDWVGVKLRVGDGVRLDVGWALVSWVGVSDSEGVGD